MDETDDLTRKLAKSASRRSLFRGLFGGGAAAVATKARPDAAAGGQGRHLPLHAYQETPFHLIITVDENSAEENKTCDMGIAFAGTRRAAVVSPVTAAPISTAAQTVTVSCIVGSMSSLSNADRNDNNNAHNHTQSCTHTPVVPASCNDNNPCTTDTCSANTCGNTPLANSTKPAGGGICCNSGTHFATGECCATLRLHGR